MFFREAGFEVTTTPYGLRVDEADITLGASHRANRAIIDRFVANHLRARLVQSVGEGLGEDGRDFRTVGAAGGATVLRGTATVAVITATSATVAAGEPMQGNYLARTGSWNELRRRLVALERTEQALLDFFSSTATPGSRTAAGVLVAGRLTPPSELPDADALEAFIDELVSRSLQDELLASVVARFNGSGLRLHAARGASGVVLHRARRPQAVIRATHARLHGGSRVEGNFLSDSAPWAELREKMLARERPSATAPRDSPMEPLVLMDFPPGLHADLQGLHSMRARMFV